MAENKKPGKIVLVLDNIRSVYNTGSIFRTADCAGVSKVICLGATPLPIDRFGRKRKDFAKVALGAEDSICWEYMEKFKRPSSKHKMVCLEQHTDSVNYKKIKLMRSCENYIVVGNEVEGVSKYLLNMCDEIAEIPMQGKKESLNVSVATGIILFSLIA
jgi:tRNA G18 (ribose-2'-O)-methylase SpoU